jgi:SPP1 gp7 family putative phage head morphogenesis protein
VPDVISLAEQYALAAERRDMAALERLIRAYQRMYSRLASQIELLAQQIGAGEMTTGQLARMTQFKSLMSQIESELGNYSVVLSNELSAGAEDAIARALADSRNLINTAARQSGIEAGFNSLPKDVVTRVVGMMQDGSPLAARIAELAPYHAQAIRDLFIDGVGLGWNPRKIAAQITRQFGMSLTDALRMTRTAQIYSYREATRANYVAAGDLITGWQWMANVSDPRTCMSCIRLSGKIFPTKNALNDHYNGNCTMLPVIRGRDPFISETDGVDWFNAQPEAEQRARMGKVYHSAWKQGYFKLEDMSGTYNDAVYGTMQRTRPLWDLLGAEPPLRTR